MDNTQHAAERKGEALAVRVSSTLGDEQLSNVDAIEISKSILLPPLESRVMVFHAEVGGGIKQLHAAGGPSVDELRQDDAFVSAMFKAVQVAATTHDSEKLDALRNAVLNAAIDNSIDSATQMLFLRFVDEFTVLHVRVLRALQNTEAAALERGVSPRSTVFAQELGQVIKGIFPELDAQEELRRIIHSDLFTRGLIGSSIVSSQLTPTGTNKFTTPLGDKFLGFIAAPKMPAAP